ncbi:glycosyltransferase [Bizionia argentinensis JUB59]|uniref:Glycosyltransferase n=1 Tax=Bizionia argentinensis JUB59 TaxID=1046627 RepID=G2EHH3_9FLAO|nr:glycosyltransferase [Bizionia argentinensis]EGV42082.1 glycosyltransferase [Bizionia argentinensis JUB59]
MLEKKHILVAPLNWGLGHATRCIPIIKELMHHKFTPILASDGAALALLQTEFPNLTCLTLPSYNIKYAKNARFFKFKLLTDTPKILRNMAAEKSAIDKILKEHSISGIISDNRFGVFSSKVPSVFITHQLNVLSGNTTWLSSKIHRNIIKKFDECWIPDAEGAINLSGKLGHVKKLTSTIKYMNPISRFTKKDTPIIYDILVLLSGPEPQRQFLETKLLKELANYPGAILFIKGLVENEIKKEVIGNFTIYNYLTSRLLEDALNKSQLVISRSGYTTLMDLAKLEKQAFFIPTPGQFEQNYLAERLQQNEMVPYCQQNDFTVEQLKRVSKFKGLRSFKEATNYTELFSLFHTK